MREIFSKKKRITFKMEINTFAFERNTSTFGKFRWFKFTSGPAMGAAVVVVTMGVVAAIMVVEEVDTLEVSLSYQSSSSTSKARVLPIPMFSC